MKPIWSIPIQDVPVELSPPTATKTLRARDLQALTRKIYAEHGVEQRPGNHPAKHAAQRLYEITRTLTQYVATPKRKETNQ